MEETASSETAYPLLEKAKEDGHHYPIEFKFRIRERESKFTGNTYKELQPIFVASGNNIEGNLGLDPRDNPANDLSIPSNSTGSPAQTVLNKATQAQWDQINALAKEIFPQGYTAQQLLDAINMAVDEGNITLQALVGSGSVKIVGKGDLSEHDATEAIKALQGLLESEHLFSIDTFEEAIKSFYETTDLDVKAVERREFMFSHQSRHKAFPSVDALREYAVETAPRFYHPQSGSIL